ncbi:sugar phosphate isomerase/epimerase [Pullulanibacillus pueri]|uniref:Xylose isomerase-like TIM barrel domain-containing protein n=1 Tax=Pullulanibacillus pueri TaxID=1437324 RepID=A0A8J2ZUC5_9BACL|nr:TIM barrel protein [Pullulanibacillus pueri]MBM7680766.1 sugar phosphate isomerase/epimerase [Pullulanibacillus pueri]GGH78251.1 hypothetical protein GCM10007096_11390 [Pullulanibacillus pueri]
MSRSIGISGSTIMSAPEQIENLFDYGVSHIEIGEFPDEEAFQKFLQLHNQRHVTFGVHAPIYRSGSKNDLLQKVKFPPEVAWEQLEKEAKRLSSLGADYILVHFPFLIHDLGEEGHQTLEQALRRLSDIQRQHGIMIVCEPKLGVERSALAIKTLQSLPIDTWGKYGLKLCIDVGDYALATGDKFLDYLKKWRHYVKIVHLHNIEYRGDKYYWVPIHPSHEEDGQHVPLKAVIEQLSLSPDVVFVLEHTPHLNPGDAFVREGLHWLQELLKMKPI